VGEELVSSPRSPNLESLTTVDSRWQLCNLRLGLNKIHSFLHLKN